MDRLSEAELTAIESRANAASDAPWRAWVEGRDGESFETFIQQGDEPGRIKDLYLSYGRQQAGVSDEDLDFIANARQDVYRLIAEVRRLRADLRA